GSERGPRAVVPLAEDPAIVPRRFLVLALPDDDEVSGGIGRDRRRDLVPRRVRVHMELAPSRGARGVEPLSEDAAVVQGRFLILTPPDDDEIAARVGRNRGRNLVVGRE